MFQPTNNAMKKNYRPRFLLLFAITITGFISYGGNATLILPGSAWKFLDNGSDQGTAWYAPSFNDATWMEGATEMGYGDGGEATVVSFGPDANNKYTTTYFRKTFNITNPSLYKSVLIGIRADDGAAVYINGIEVARYNLSAGAVYNTLASSNIANHFENVYHHYKIDPSLFITGSNVIAVEVHQDDVTSSDLSFNFELLVSTEKTLISRGDEWKFLDDGSDQGTAWKDEVFDDSPWALGKAILGYNSTIASSLQNTTVSYGPSASNKYITTYFRKTINIPDTNLLGNFTLNMFLDDGAIIYVNGVESNRINLPIGAITYTTTAPTAVGTASWVNYSINKTLFKNGNNVIAVEVHQQAITSSDMNFELELMESPATPLAGGGCTDQNMGCFTSVAASCQSPGLIVLPSTHTFQVLAQQGDPYQTGGGSMPTNNDFTAYVPINGSSESGYLSINHETNPGGVSMLDMHYNIYTGLWEVDDSRAVSFAQVVKTERPCSGGITPWGTVVMSEEAMTGGDVNTDGYTDIGWHVEINPVTKQIVDYDNNGFSDKLWALGRSNKENICFNSDSLTAYFGLDAGSTSYIYKFIADQKMDLSAGNLYVLKQNVYLGNTAFWVQVPNTTQADQNNCTTISTGLGATSFNKVEDVEIGLDGKIYFTSSNEGRVYRFSDTPSITDFEIFINKLTYTVNDGTGTSSALFNNCDNLAFDPIDGNLWVNIDGNCNYLWMVRPDHTSIAPQIEIFARMPSGAESGGTTFSPDGRFMFFSIMHPTNNSITMIDAAGNSVIINKATTVVVARNEHLGALAAVPFVELGNNTAICQGTDITLDAGPGHAQYAWNTGATSQTINVTTGGTYIVQVTGANGKTNADTINIMVNTLPSAPVAASVNFCDGDIISPLAATGTTVEWFSDALLTNQVATGNTFNTGNTAVGTYTYFTTQTDANNCKSTATEVDMIIHALPTSPVTSNESACETTSIPSLTSTGTNIIWYSDVTLTTQVATGSAFNTGNSTAGIYTYYATQTDVNNCTSNATTSTLTIYPQPAQPVVTGDIEYCAGETLQMLAATGNNVNWFDDVLLTNNITAGNNFTPAITTTTSFYANETSIDGCVSATTQVDVTIHNLPSAPVANDDVACENSTIPDLNATGNNVTWFSDAGLTNQVATGNSFTTGNMVPGTYSYYVIETDVNNCSSVSDMVTLTIYALPSAPSVTGTMVYCAGETIQPITSSGSNSTWYNDSGLTSIAATGTTFTPAITSTATFYVTQSVNNCVSAATPVTVTINSLPVVGLSGLNASYFVSASPVTLTGTPAGGVFSGPGISGNQFSPAAAGVGGPYAITYTYTDITTGCTNSTTSNVIVNFNTGVIELSNGSTIQVYPNPASEQMNVNLVLNSGAEVSIELVDVSGKIIHVQPVKQMSAGKHSVSINRNELNLSSGSYWINVLVDGEKTTTKVIFTR